MTKIYYSSSTKAFLYSDIHKEIPADAVEITEGYRDELLRGEYSGLEICSDDGYPSLKPREVDIAELARRERGWRDSELRRADIELNKIQDSDPKSTATVGDWRAYRKTLRAWPEHPNFPDKSFRPTRP